MATLSERELIEFIARSLVDEPDAVQVNVIEGEQSIILELRVGSQDVGKVIGKHGRIAKELRTVLSAATSRSGRRVVLEILD